jgi:hypothetical protein
LLSSGEIGKALCKHETQLAPPVARGFWTFPRNAHHTTVAAAAQLSQIKISFPSSIIRAA